MIFTPWPTEIEGQHIHWQAVMALMVCERYGRTKPPPKIYQKMAPLYKNCSLFS